MQEKGKTQKVVELKIRDGWFEENEDGTRDYIAILENGEAVRLKNAYLTSIHIDGLEPTGDAVDVDIAVSTCGNTKVYNKAKQG